MLRQLLQELRQIRLLLKDILEELRMIRVVVECGGLTKLDAYTNTSWDSLMDKDNE